jgi:hypothetical protein
MGMHLGNWPQDDCLRSKRGRKLSQQRRASKEAKKKKEEKRREKDEKRRERSHPKFSATRAGHVYGSSNFLSAVQVKSA